MPKPTRWDISDDVTFENEDTYFVIRDKQAFVTREGSNDLEESFVHLSPDETSELILAILQMRETHGMDMMDLSEFGYVPREMPEC